jgi:very-short-patch-repair endonuclease
MRNYGAARLILDRHSQRREQGIPTLSLLSGDWQQAERLWLAWADVRKQVIVRWSVEEPVAELYRTWLQAARSIAHEQAFRLLSIGGRYTKQELGQLLDDLQGEEAERVVEQIAEGLWWREHAPESAVRLRIVDVVRHTYLERELDGLPCSWEQLSSTWEAWFALLGERVPAVLASLVREPKLAEQQVKNVDTLLQIIEFIPTFTVAMIANDDDLNAVSASLSNRKQALLKEGKLVWEIQVPKLQPASVSAKQARLPDTPEQPFPQSSECLPKRDVDPAFEPTSEPAFESANEAFVHGKVDPALDQALDHRELSFRARCEELSAEQARSLAEKVLFERLEREDSTHGRFRLNQLLAIKFGNRRMEIDLYSSDLRFAIEVDGIYHFLQPESYRRDRRKDLVFQQLGILVYRVLAEDVLEDVDHVVAGIVAAVDLRIQQLTPTNVIH